MGKMVIRKLNHEVQGNSFDCGNDSINRQIQESYYPTLLQYAYAYEVNISNHVVAYYMVYLRTINISQAPAELTDYQSSIVHNCSAIHINYIAVDKRFQHRCIGTNILKTIIVQVLEICKKLPITIITLDALKEKYDWYKGIGFVAFDEKEVSNSEITIPMYINCILDRDAVNNYCDEI